MGFVDEGFSLLCEFFNGCVGFLYVVFFINKYISEEMVLWSMMVRNFLMFLCFNLKILLSFYNVFISV